MHIKIESTAKLPTKYGEFTISATSNDSDNKEHLIVSMGEVSKSKDILTRIHSECITGDLFGSLRCDCGNQLSKSLEKIGRHGSGILVYLRQEGRGIGLVNKLKAYNLQDKGLDTVEANHQLGFEADERNYEIAANLLKKVGATNIQLMTNNPSKSLKLAQYGINIQEIIPLTPEITKHNKKYLETKVSKMGHNIEIPPQASE